MKILMISADRGLFGGGSSGDVIERHQKYADAAGHLDVVVFADTGYEPVDHSNNFRVFPSRSGKLTHWRRAAQVALRLARENEYSLVHAQDIAAPAGERVKRETGLPLTVSIHSMFFSSEWLKLNPLNWYLLWRLKRAMRVSDGFRVNTAVIAQKVRDWFGDVPVLVQPTPVDLNSFYIQNSNSKIRDASRPVSILYVGRLSPEKNVQLLIKAAAALKANEAISYKLNIVGSGSERPKLENLAKKLGVDDFVSFLGPKPYEKLPEIYKNADIFVLPSNTESFGKVLLEAAAAKCAIVATETAGANTILTNEKDALLTPVGNQKELKAALDRLISDKNLRVALGEEACATARGYGSDAGIAKTVAFWQQIAGRK